MAFENKDLLTKLLPQISEHYARGCWLHSLICQWPTFRCHATGGCGPSDMCRGASMTTICYGDTGFCQGRSMTTRPTRCPIVSLPFVIEDQEDLIALREDLVDTLQKLEKLQHDGLPSTITTLAEANELEESLKRQLEHVRKVRKELE